MKKKSAILGYILGVSFVLIQIILFSGFASAQLPESMLQSKIDFKGDVIGYTFVQDENTGNLFVKLYKLHGKNGSLIWETNTIQDAINFFYLGVDILIDNKGDIFIKGISSDLNAFVSKYRGLDGSKVWEIEKESTDSSMSIPSINFTLYKNGDLMANWQAVTTDGSIYNFIAKFRGSDGFALWEKNFKVMQ
jgi:hypothetical protein